MTEMIDKILAHLVQTRSRAEVVYRPYYAPKGIRQKAVLGGTTVSLAQMFREMPGKKVFLKTLLQAPRTTQAYINIAGKHGKVWLDGQEISPKLSDERGHCYELSLNETPKALVIERPLEDLGDITVTLSTTYYRCMDAKDYLIHMKMLSPYGYGMEGIGISVPCDESATPDRVTWDAPWAAPADNSIDFSDFFTAPAGSYALALTGIAKSGTVRLHGGRCFLDGAEVEGEISVRAGQQLLVQVQKTAEPWAISWEDPDNCLTLPVAEAGFGKFLILGPLSEAGLSQGIQFTAPYEAADGGKTFWKLCAKDVVLRPYLDTSFFGQWFYALMVGNYGLLKSGTYRGRQDLLSYFDDGMRLMAKFYDLAKWETAVYGEPTFLQRAMVLDNLDSIGAMGLCLCECYQRTKDASILRLLHIMLDAAKHNIPRFDDGTYHRETTMWADDIFMSLPFLMRMWEITGDDWCLLECFRQLGGFKARLYMDDQNIFSHIFFLDTGVANRVPWGRGNGWIFLTMGDLLKKMTAHKVAEKYPEEYAWLVTAFRAFASGLMACQDEEGMLHQVLNDRTSYRETSCTGMFATAISYGIQAGILDRSCLTYVEKAIGGLLRHSITEDGVILGVCRGSSCSMNPEYYKQLGTVDDDDHGTGILLLAMTALQELKEN